MPCCFIEAFTTSSTAAPNVPAGSGLEAEEEELPPPQLANQTRLVNKKRREKHTGRTRFMFSPGGQVYTSCQCGVCDWLRPWAVAQRELGRFEDALSSSSEALGQVKTLLERDSNNRDFLHFLGRALTERARTLSRAPERRVEAEKCFSDAILIWQNLQKRYPQIPLYYEWQALAYESRGQLRTAADQAGSAEQDFDKSRVLLEALVKQVPAIPGYSANLGRTYGSLGRLALARGDIPRAMDWLRKAVAAGWNTPRHIAQMARDPDLDALRHRPDFRRLLAGLFDQGFPADPFAP